MKKHVNVALFVPHSGCPHRCSFCNQRTISGQMTPLTPDDVRRAAEVALRTGGAGGEIAFFGGSFTAIDRQYMIDLLESAKPYIDSGAFSGIRCSTRPDAIDDARLDILSSYGVSAIELGAQSMNDAILRESERGHTAADVRAACEKISAYGIELGLQMMTGLPGDSGAESMQTAEAFIQLKPKTVRIYPTVVLEGTALAERYRAGDYRPQTLPEATELCADLLLLFHKNDISVIRMGLHSGGNVEDGYLAGAYHPAFRELCENKIYLNLLKEQLYRRPEGNYRIGVAPSEISKAVGQKRSNIHDLQEQGYTCKIIAKENLPVYQVEIQENSLQ